MIITETHNRHYVSLSISMVKYKKMDTSMTRFLQTWDSLSNLYAKYQVSSKLHCKFFGRICFEIIIVLSSELLYIELWKIIKSLMHWI